MSTLDLTTIGLQIMLPLALIAWLAFAPAHSRIGFLAQAGGTVTFLLGLMLVAIWIMPPWWVPYLYLALWLGAVLWRASGGIKAKTTFPTSASGWTVFALFLVLGAWSANASLRALEGRSPPAAMDVVDLAFPMSPGVYLIANGGATATVNAHFLTLAPRTERQAAYRGQSFGVDMVKLGPLGLRASGWRPTDPADYEIFGTPVVAPCAGKVIEAGDDMPDMPIPEPDTTRLEGNHVILRCNDYLVLLAHLKRGSLIVATGDDLEIGQQLGDAGNSGQSYEPHLHVHAQRPPESGPLLSGEPLHVTFHGRFPVRGDRLRITGGAP